MCSGRSRRNGGLWAADACAASVPPGRDNSRATEPASPPDRGTLGRRGPHHRDFRHRLAATDHRLCTTAAITWHGTASPQAEQDQRTTFNGAGTEDRPENMS